MRRLCAVAALEDQGRKVKYFVRSTLGVSYRQFSALKTYGGLQVNGEVVHANHLLNCGDRVEVLLTDPPRKTVEQEETPVHIVYEDDDLIIIDKPAPLACQCSPKQPAHTLENRLAWRYRDRPDFVFRPLNRLDRGTSGLMVAALNAHACQRLQHTLHTPQYLREYLAVTEGLWSGSGIIDLPIAKEKDASVRRIVDPENGKSAVTHYHVENQGNGRTLVRLRLETGRTHQIRVHLSHMGHPVSGDFLYGSELQTLPGRFALHSARVALLHPITGIPLEYCSPLPRSLEILMKETKSHD